jgi:hypothetical protein
MEHKILGLKQDKEKLEKSLEENQYRISHLGYYKGRIQIHPMKN